MARVATVRKKKTVRATRRVTGIAAMPLDDWQKAKFYVHYEVESREWTSAVKAYVKKFLSRADQAAINALPDTKVGYGSHWATAAQMLINDREIPESYQKAFSKFISGLVAEGKILVDKKNKDESKRKTVYIPTIQENLQEATEEKLDDLEQWIDDFLVDPKKNTLKDKQPYAYFKSNEINLGHARYIKEWFSGPFEDLSELVNLPPPAKRDEMQKQLAEGYDHLTKSQQVELYDFYKKIIDAVDILRSEKKQVRPPKKVKQKSSAEQVKRLKFKASDPQFGIASVSPTELVGCTSVVVFNTKNRKLGIYYAEPNSVMQVKGTTLQFFDADRSEQKTIRKPEEVLPNWKKVTQHKLKTQFDYLKTTSTKLNGRFNEDTIILKVFR